MVLYNLQVGTYTRLVYKGEPSGIIVNRDAANSVVLGNFDGFGPSGANVLDASTFVQYSGDDDVYGSAVSGTTTVDVMEGYTNWSPSPAQAAANLIAAGIATSANQASQLTQGANQLSAINNPSYGPATLSRQITQETNIPNNMAVTGVPLLNLSSLVLSVTPNTTITVNTSTTFPGTPLQLNQPGMEIVFQVDAAGPTSVCRFTINWLDGLGNFLSNDNYWIYAGTTGNPHTIYAKGPTDGLQCTFQIGAYLTNVRIVKMLVYLNSKIYNQWQFETQSMPALANTFNLSLIEPAALIQGRRAAAVIAAGATDVTCLGMYVGQAWLFGLTSSNLNDMTIKIQNAADQFGQDFFTSYKSDGAGQINQYIQLPRGQCLLSMVNNNAAQQTMRYMLIETAD